MKFKITQKLIGSLAAEAKAYRVHDTVQPGFFIRVLPSDHKSYMVTWGRNKNATLGRVGVLTLDQARTEAAQYLADAHAHGGPLAIAQGRKGSALPSLHLYAVVQSSSQRHSTIQIARDTGFVGGGCFVAVHIDGRAVARIDTGEVVSLYVTPGEHLIGLGADEHRSGTCSWSGTLKEQTTILKAGQTKRLRIGGDTSAGLDIRPSSF